jgi:hypothetical protein
MVVMKASKWVVQWVAKKENYWVEYLVVWKAVWKAEN